MWIPRKWAANAEPHPWGLQTLWGCVMKVSSYAVAIALALAALGMPAGHAAESQRNGDVAKVAKQALTAEMGDRAKDIKVTVDQRGYATLSGWAQGPSDVSKARLIVRKVPGVKKAFSSRVRTLNSTDEHQDK